MASPRLAVHRLVLLAILLGFVGTPLGGSIRVLAQEDAWVLEDENFSDTEHRWSVEWDEDDWEGELVRGDDYRGVGLTLKRNVFSRQNIGVARQAEHEDIDACLAWQESTGQYDLEREESEDPPETAEDAAGQLYAATDEQEELDVLVYQECRPLAADNLFLLVNFVIDERAYEDNIGVWEDLLAGIQVEDGDDSSGDSGGPGLDGNVYTDVEYGWSVEFDEEIFRGGPLDGDDFTGLNLQYTPESGYSGFNNLLVFDDGITDAEECLETRIDAFSDSSAFEDFEEETREDPPQTADDAEGQLFSTTLMPEETDIFYYLECRPLQEATLTVQLAVDVDSYEDALPAWEDLLASIDTSASTSGGDDGEREERNGELDADEAIALDGNVFTDQEYGWSVEFDEEVWSGRTVENDQFQGVVLSYVDSSWFGIDNDLFVYDDGIADPADCLSARIEAVSENSDYLDFEESEDDPPATDSDAEGQLFTTTLFSDEGGTDLYYYLECRPLASATLSIQLRIDASHFEDALPAWEDLLASVDTSAISPEDESAGLDGNTFADPVVGYMVEFDDDVWEANELEGADGSDREGEPVGVFLRIADDPSFATVTIDGASGYDGMSPEECVEAYMNSLPNVGPYSDIELADDLDAPRSSDDAEGAVYRYTYTFEDGSDGEFVAYMECRPTGDDSMVRIFLATFEADLEDQADVFEELLDGITVTGAGDPSGDEPVDDEPADDEDE